MYSIPRCCSRPTFHLRSRTRVLFWGGSDVVEGVFGHGRIRDCSISTIPSIVVTSCGRIVWGTKRSTSAWSLPARLSASKECTTKFADFATAVVAVQSNSKGTGRRAQIHSLSVGRFAGTLDQVLIQGRTRRR